MRFVNDITLMTCQHHRLSPRSSLDHRGVCISCGQKPEHTELAANTGNFERTCVLRVAPIVDVDRGVIYR